MEKKNTHLAYGLITAIIMIIVNLVLYITGVIYNPDYKFISMLGYIPFLIGIIMNAIAFSKARDGFVSFGNVFGSCFKATLIIMLVLVVWGTISLFVFPEMKDKMLEMSREQMIKNKNMTDDQVDMALNMTKKYWSLFMYIGVIFGTMIFGAIFSLIGGAIANKKGEPPMSATNF